MKKKKGFSIVEVLLVASLGTFLLALVAVLLVRSIESNRVVQGHLQNTLVRRDLATTLRHDLYRAESATIADGKLSIELQDQSIIYHKGNDSVERSVMEDGNQVRNDSYFFSRLHDVQFEKRSISSQAFLVVSVKKKIQPNAPPVTGTQIVSQIGKHLSP